MMVIVLGYEESQVNDAHPYLQARVNGLPLYERFRVSVQAANELHPFAPEGCENIFYAIRIVIRVKRSAILQVGDVKLFAARLVVVQPFHPQRLKVK
jgi:hypothetical protein